MSTHKRKRPAVKPSAPTASATPAPIVIRFAQSLPIPETFAPTLAAHIKAGGRLLFDDRNGYGIETDDFRMHDWLIRLDLAMRALGLPEWAASAPGYYTEGWCYIEHGHSERILANVADLLSGTLSAWERNDSIVPMASIGSDYRNHFHLRRAGDLRQNGYVVPWDYWHPVAWNTRTRLSTARLGTVEMPMQDFRLGCRLTDMPLSAAEGEDAEIVKDVELEEFWADVFGREA